MQWPQPYGRKLRREKRVKLENVFFAARRAPVLVPHALYYSPCTFPSCPCPTLDAFASLSLQVERTRRQVQDTATTKASQPRHRHPRGVTCKIIDVLCACRQGGKGHHSTQTPPGKKQHRQPTAQHSTARRRTTGHRRAKQTQTAPQNDSRARQHSATVQHSATAQDTGKQDTAASTTRHRSTQSGEDRERTARGKEPHSTQTPPRGKEQHSQPTAQHSTARQATGGQNKPQQHRNTTAEHNSTAPCNSTAPQHTTQGSRAPQPTTPTTGK